MESHIEKEGQILKNRFTGYLMVAMLRYKIRYCNKEKRRQEMWSLQDDMRQELDRHGFVEPGLRKAEVEEVWSAVNTLKPHEKYVVLARTVHDKSFVQIASEMNRSYKGVAALYYRAIKKIRKKYGGDHEFY